VLLVTLGSPSSPRIGDVRRYLREFLSDPRVLDIPRAARWLLLNLVILPFRPRKSAAAYAQIWSDEGSPLLVHSRALRDGVAKSLGPGFAVELGMRYGAPSIADALERLAETGVEGIIVVPLYPQYAAASTGSTLAKVFRLAAASWNIPEIQTLGPFYAHSGFISALAAVAKPGLDAFRPDYVLLSYHGLPERQIRKSDIAGRQCLETPDCCKTIGATNRFCYRAQCFATSRALAAALELSPDDYDLAFQSRLGRTPWIRPHTDVVLPQLAARGIRRLAVICPSFVADCVETLEEIGIRARTQWREVGGEELLLVPCINAHPAWVETLAQMVREAALV
jgi:ferrochelatase